jgi:hypothetical protein
MVDPASLLRAIDRAEQLRLFDGIELSALIERANGHPGTGALQAALARCSPDPPFTRSELERRFLARCESSGIPRPRTKVILEFEDETIEVDFQWPEQRLVIETDSYGFHSSRRAFESDRSRDQALTLSGWRVVRFTWRQLAEDSEKVTATLRALLRL